MYCCSFIVWFYLIDSTLSAIWVQAAVSFLRWYYGWQYWLGLMIKISLGKELVQSLACLSKNISSTLLGCLNLTAAKLLKWTRIWWFIILAVAITPSFAVPCPDLFTKVNEFLVTMSRYWVRSWFELVVSMWIYGLDHLLVAKDYRSLIRIWWFIILLSSSCLLSTHDYIVRCYCQTVVWFIKHAKVSECIVMEKTPVTQCSSLAWLQCGFLLFIISHSHQGKLDDFPSSHK